MDSLQSWFILLRPRQWVKNLLVLAPIWFAFNYEADIIARGITMFVAFCFGASAIYIINDLRDIETDRHHPKKKNRPLASGAVSIPVAQVSAAVLAAVGLYISFTLSLQSLLVLLGYMLLTILYTISLKRVLILDVMVLAAGFVIRILAGGAATDIRVSHWILICTFFIALFMAFGKRKHEIDLLGGASVNHRAVLAGYSPEYLNQLLGITSGISVLSYALYTIDPQTQRVYGGDLILLTILPVTFVVFRYLHILYSRERGGDPSRVLTEDFPLVVSVLIWLLIIISIRFFT